MLFQSVTRLRHYILFPTLKIDNERIDNDSAAMWYSILPPEIHHNYTSIYLESILANELHKVPNTPRQWYNRCYMIEHWHTTQNHTAADDQTTIQARWQQLSTKEQSKYVMLSILDHKRQETKKIEQFLAANAIHIGVHSPYTKNVTVSLLSNKCQPTTLVSAIFAYKISRLSINLF